jgi:hypothetical protein
MILATHKITNDYVIRYMWLKFRLRHRLCRMNWAGRIDKARRIIRLTIAVLIALA